MKTIITSFKTYWLWLFAPLSAAALALGLVWAQGAATPPPASGAALGLTAQVVGPVSSGTLNSDYSVSTGDTVQFTAYIPPQLDTPSNRVGSMSFPAGFTWTAGSVLTPPNVENLRWNIGTVAAPNWVIAEPVDGKPVSQFEWTVKPIVTLDIKPLAAPSVNFQGTGDGYRVFTYKNTAVGFEKDNLYVLNHHTAQTYLNCRDAKTGNACAGYESGGKSVSATNDIALAANLEPSLITPNRNIEHLNSATGEVFFFTGDDKGDIRVMCANLNTLKSCTTAKIVGKSISVNADAVNPVGSIASKFYALSNNGDVLCYDVSTKNICAGAYPFKAKTINIQTRSTSMNIIMEDKIFYEVDGKLACFNTSTVNYCSEPLWTINPSTAVAYGLYPVLNVDGTPKGVCTPTACRTLNGAIFTPLSQSANYKFFLDSNQMFTAQGRWGSVEGSYTQANYFGTQVYHNTSNNLANFASCFDFKTNTLCNGFPINHPTGEEVRIYAITKDTVRDNCMWAIGDPALARSFDPRNGADCKGNIGIPQSLKLTVDPAANVKCDGSATAIRGWKAIRFSRSLPWGVGYLTSMGVSIADGNGNPIPNTNASAYATSFVSGQYELDISRIPYQKYPKLIVTLTPTTGDTALNVTVGLDITWDGDPAQVCVKTKAPVLPLCSDVSASAQVDARPVDTPTAAPDTIKASQNSAAGVMQTGIGPGQNSTTLLQQPKGGSDPTQIMQTRFDMSSYTGDLFQYELLSAGTISASPISKASLEAASNRKYYTSKGETSGQPTLTALALTNLSVAHQAALNQNLKGEVDNAGANRIAYIKGDRSKELGAAGGVFRQRKAGDAGLLGPVIGSSPVILHNTVLAGLSNTVYPFFTKYKQNVKRKDKLVFYSGNDGMLHAYKVDATGLTEAFSYMPSFVIPDVPRYTDSSAKDIRGENKYFLDNTPMVADVNLADSRMGDKWRSVVVANRGRGGRGVFALDVTAEKAGANAAQTKPDAVLFEYSNTTAANAAAGEGTLADLGKQLGQPMNDKVSGGEQIVRVRSGAKGVEARWAYITGNGVDSNVSSAVDVPVAGTSNPVKKSINLNRAVLYLFYLNANVTPAAGARWTRIPVHADASFDADLDLGNGLSTPRPVDVDGDGVVDYVYAGDVKGNLWRFDLRDMASVKVTKIFQTIDKQPIHTAPVVSRYGAEGTCGTAAVGTAARHCLMVVFGTGAATNAVEPLPISATASPVQRFYGLFDKGETGAAGLIAVSKLTQQTLTSATAAGSNGFINRTVSQNKVEYKKDGQRGWQIALPANEHTTANPVLQTDGTVKLASTKRSLTAPSCTDGFLTQLNIGTGWSSGDNIQLPNSVEGVRSYTVPSAMGGTTANSSSEHVLLAGGTGPAATPAAGSAAGATLKTDSLSMIGRLSWREVFGAKKE
jgi:Tfp pilus tip-associated adhesin PilY1